MEEPIERGPHSTGMWYRLYQVTENTNLRSVCGGRPAAPNAKREWLALFEVDGTRREDIEEQLLQRLELKPFLSITNFGGSDFATFKESDLDAVIGGTRAVLSGG